MVFNLCSLLVLTSVLAAYNMSYSFVNRLVSHFMVFWSGVCPHVCTGQPLAEHEEQASHGHPN